LKDFSTTLKSNSEAYLINEYNSLKKVIFNCDKILKGETV